MKTPTLTLTSTLSVSKMSPAHFVSPFIPAPRNTATQRSFGNKTTSESSVRQNLLSVLDQDGSTSVTCDLSTTNSESRTLSVTPAFQFNAPKISGPGEKKNSKPTTFGKRPYPKQTASGSAKRNMAPPLGEQNNSLNIKASTNQPSSIHPGILRQRPISSSGNYVIQLIESAASYPGAIVGGGAQWASTTDLYIIGLRVPIILRHENRPHLLNKIAKNSHGSDN